MLVTQAEEIVRCANDFHHFIKNYIKLYSATEGLITFPYEAWHARLTDSLTENRFLIAIKWRQGGLMTTTLAYSLWRCLFFSKQSIAWVENSTREAAFTGEQFHEMYMNLPIWMKSRLCRNNSYEKHFADTESKITFRIAPNFRGWSCTHLIVNEAAFIKNMDKHWKTLVPTIFQSGQAVILSTPNGCGNWFWEAYNDAVDNKNWFYVFNSNYKENPLYTPKYCEEARKALGEKSWLQEVEQTFIGSL